MFTLALCLITIWIIDAVKAKISNKVLWYSISIVVVGISCAVAMALSLDYDYHATVTYNGERGRQNKWINYLFYPVHILILGILRFYLNI